MKTIFNKLGVSLLLLIAVMAGCKKDPVMYAKGIESFSFKIKDAQNVEKEYQGVITDGNIEIVLPTEVDVTELKAIFKTDNPRTIVQVGNEVQESGITIQDFTTAKSYRVKAEDKSTRSYTVTVNKKIALTSYGFYKEDNPSLPADYVGIIRGFEVEVAIPETVSFLGLKARFTTTTGASLKVGAVDQQSKVTANNFDSQVTYTFNEPSLTTPFEYKVNVVFLGKQWELFGDDLTVPTAASPKMAINPINSMPYFIYQRTGKGEDGLTIATDNRKVAVMGYVGGQWQNLGDKLGISDFRADAQTIAFNSTGELYVAYKDYFGAEQRGTVKKYTGGVWSAIGNSRFTPMKVDYLTMAMDASDVPMISMTKQSNATEYPSIPQRGVYVTSYKNSAWGDATGALTGKTMFQNNLIRGLDGNIYLGLMERTTGANRPSLYKFANNVWTAVGPTSFSAPDGLVGFQSVAAAVDKTGQAYLAFQVGSGANRMNHVMKYNAGTNTWQEIGNGVLSGAVSDTFALVVDKEDNLYFAYANATSLVVKTLNKITNNWNTERKIINEKINAFDIQAAPNGLLYVVASLATSSKTVVYRYE